MVATLRLRVLALTHCATLPIPEAVVVFLSSRRQAFSTNPHLILVEPAEHTEVSPPPLFARYDNLIKQLTMRTTLTRPTGYASC